MAIESLCPGKLMANHSTVLERLNFYVDLDRYPIHELDSNAGKEVVQRAHEMVARDTLCVFEGFPRATTLTRPLHAF